MCLLLIVCVVYCHNIEIHMVLANSNEPFMLENKCLQEPSMLSFDVFNYLHEWVADNNFSSLWTGFLVYAGIVIVVVLVLIFYYVPRNGRTHMIVYIGICSLMGSLTVCLSKSRVKTLTVLVFKFSSSLLWHDVVSSYVGYVCQSCEYCLEVDFWRK